MPNPWRHLRAAYLQYLQSLTILPLAFLQSVLVIFSHLPLMQQLICGFSAANANGAAIMNATRVIAVNSLFIGYPFDLAGNFPPPPFCSDYRGGEPVHATPGSSRMQGIWLKQRQHSVTREKAGVRSELRGGPASSDVVSRDAPRFNIEWLWTHSLCACERLQHIV